MLRQQIVPFLTFERACAFRWKLKAKLFFLYRRIDCGLPFRRVTGEYKKGVPQRAEFGNLLAA